MITVTWYGKTFTAEYAVKGKDYVALYDEAFAETARIDGIHGKEWEKIILDGEWSEQGDIPTTEEILRADVDFLTMENEALEETTEQQQADIDYCLMLLDEE